MSRFNTEGTGYDNQSLASALDENIDAGHRPAALRQRGCAIARLVGAGAATGAVLAALAVPAAASGAPNIWAAAQVGLTYPVYQPKTVLALGLSNFKLLSCAAGQEDSVYATYGKAYNPSSNYGKLPGFSVAEGYPSICSLPGAEKTVGTWTVGTPNGSVRVGVSVYCNPAQFKSCTTASGLKNGYLLQWAQPYKSTQFLKKKTQIYIETSRLTLPQALHVVAGLSSVGAAAASPAAGTAKPVTLQSLGKPTITAKCSGGQYRPATPNSPMTTIRGKKWTSGFSLIGTNCDTSFTWRLNTSYSTLVATLALDAANSGPLSVQFRSGNVPIRFQSGGKTVSQLKVTASSSVQINLRGLRQLSIVLPNPGSDAGILDVTTSRLA
ncbi:MAG TPA: hypothetical protein VMF65_09895 [Acidimicrobiales bacterium]|nr:hypothetical protein [Acidimicrobiales bacterium]